MNNVKTAASDSYHDYLIDYLSREPHLAAAYITETIAEADPEPELLKTALTQVAEALYRPKVTAPEFQEHITKLDELLDLNTSLTVYNLAEWLEKLGLTLTVVVDTSTVTNSLKPVISEIETYPDYSSRRLSKKNDMITGVAQN